MRTAHYRSRKRGRKTKEKKTAQNERTSTPLKITPPQHSANLRLELGVAQYSVNRLLFSCLGILLSQLLPHVGRLAKMKERKKVRIRAISEKILLLHLSV